MAEKRMLTAKVTDNDNFTELSAEAQALYMHIIMSADDDGFCAQIRPCMYKAHANKSNLAELINARFIIAFGSGVVAVKHWFMHNALRKDRYSPTSFSDERAELFLKENGSYTENVEQAAENVARRIEENRIEENSIEKNSIEENSIEESNTRARAKEPPKRFTPPTTDEVSAYAKEKGYQIDADRFVDFYASKGWLVGKSPMKDWKAAVRNWATRDRKEADAKKPKPPEGWEDIDQYFHKAGG